MIRVLNNDVVSNRPVSRTAAQLALMLRNAISVYRRCRQMVTSILVLVVLALTPVHAVDYEVGPEKEFTSLDRVGWEGLLPGDRVLIHWRKKAYHAKWVLCCRGTPQRPIVVRGVRGPQGQFPVIDGKSAVTRPSLNFWNEDRGIIKVGGANRPPDTMPAHLIIEGLEIRGARPANLFFSRSGIKKYRSNAAAIYIEKGENITIRDCKLLDSGNGLLVAPQSKHIVIENCEFADNGIEGSVYEHSAYSESEGIVYQGNRFRPLRKGCRGNALKDRSAGLIIRYNWIEGGNRQLDLVEAEGGKHFVRLPSYRDTFVYGNVLIETKGSGNNQVVHYGGDSGKTDTYRKGTLHFYHNTVVSLRNDPTTLFRLSTDDEHLDCRNNIFHVTARGRILALLDESGRATLRNNWFTNGFVQTHSNKKVLIKTVGDRFSGDSPGFVNIRELKFGLAADSAGIDRAALLHARTISSARLLRQYEKHRRLKSRTKQGVALDLGAFEFTSATNK